ncbi:RHS repeat-associated core domain-containing protein [Pseudomonas sp. TWI923]|uniref:RHS repeat-associated core domain-containing protein n=1 Tax=Pseudomonas sp. TWI923 TaxID=3136794 RepID=UPI0032093DF7
MDQADNPLRFQGQYYDEETGLHYNRHRYYNPQTGRYLTPDPIGLAGGVNGYLYGVNPSSRPRPPCNGLRSAAGLPRARVGRHR